MLSFRKWGRLWVIILGLALLWVGRPAQAVVLGPDGPPGPESVRKGKRLASPLPEKDKPGKRAQYAPGELLVRFKNGMLENRRQEVQKIHERQGCQVKKEFSPLGIQVLKIASKRSAKETIAAYRRDPNVEFAEPNYIVHAAGIPNDPSFPLLWGLHNTGQEGGTPDADIDAPEAWDLTTGSRSVVVAVIDTGVDYTHPDLAGNLWHNPREIPNNGLDDDGNGFVDDGRGWDFFNEENDPLDDHGHGTHVAGTIGALGNNGLGVAGVNWQVQIMPLKFLGAEGFGFTDGAIGAILYAAMNGAHILNNSWGGGGFSAALQLAIQFADSRGALFVVAAGNASNDNSQIPEYPASYDLPNVLSVAATDSNDALADFSNFGETAVHLAAPGVDIWSTVPHNAYRALSGTSMATPHVSGAAALLKALNPSMDGQALRRRLLATVDTPASLDGQLVTNGRLNARNALACSGATAARAFLTSPGHGFSVPSGRPIPIRALVMDNCGGVLAGGLAQASFDNGDPAILLYDDGLHGDGRVGDGIFAAQWIPAHVGPMTLTLQGGQPGLPIGNDTLAGIVAPDYRMDASAPFNWVEISATGTPLNLDDDSFIHSSIPFPFNFYGRDHTEVSVGSNGHVYFEDAYLGFDNTPIPSLTFDSVQEFIAAFWTDLNPTPDPTPGSPQIYVQLLGTAPNRQLVIEWQNVPMCCNSLGGVSFEVILFEGSHEILLQYQDVVFDDSFYTWADNGRSATVGIQGSPQVGLQYSFLEPSLSPGLAIRFTPILAAAPLQPLRISTDKGTYSGADTMRVDLAVQNPTPSPLTGDAYIAVQLPSRDLFFFGPGGFTPTLTPLVSGFTLNPGFSINIAPFLTIPMSGLPAGGYCWWAGFAEPDTWNWIGNLSSACFSYSP